MLPGAAPSPGWPVLLNCLFPVPLVTGHVSDPLP